MPKQRGLYMHSPIAEIPERSGRPIACGIAVMYAHFMYFLPIAVKENGGAYSSVQAAQ